MAGGEHRRSTWWLWAVIAGSMLVLLACNEVTTTPSAYSAQATPQITSEGLRPTVDQLHVDEYAAGIMARQTLVAIEARHTAEAVAREEEAWRISVTSEARHAEATATAWAVTREAQAAQATATLAAQQTATAFEMERERAIMTVEARREQEAEDRERLLLDLTVEAARAEQDAVATIRAEQLERERLATERQRLVYPVQAYGPWVLLGLAAGLMVYGGVLFVRAQETRMRTIPRDARGDAPLMVLRMNRRGHIVIDADRMFGPATVIDGEGVEMPALADEEHQAAVTMRDQAVDLASRGLPGQRQSAGRRRQAAARMVPAPPSYRVLPPDQPPPAHIISPQAVQALDVDWEREVNHG